MSMELVEENNCSIIHDDVFPLIILSEGVIYLSHSCQKQFCDIDGDKFRRRLSKVADTVYQACILLVSIILKAPLISPRAAHCGNTIFLSAWHPNVSEQHWDFSPSISDTFFPRSSSLCHWHISSFLIFGVLIKFPRTQTLGERSHRKVRRRNVPQTRWNTQKLAATSEWVSEGETLDGNEKTLLQA